MYRGTAQHEKHVELKNGGKKMNSSEDLSMYKLEEKKVFGWNWIATNTVTGQSECFVNKEDAIAYINHKRRKKDESLSKTDRGA